MKAEQIKTLVALSDETLLRYMRYRLDEQWTGQQDDAVLELIWAIDDYLKKPE